MRVVRNTLDGLERDLKALPARSVRDCKATMRQAGIVGNTVARDNARKSSGTHGKLYPRAFTWETGAYVGGFGASFTATYGPDANRPQGGMSFEFGSRKQAGPHLDLARSADLMGPVVAKEVRDMVDGWFW